MAAGDIGSGGTAQALTWLRPEVLASAQRIRRAVEVQQDQEPDSIAIKAALLEMRQIEGALELCELWGPAILAHHIRVSLQDVLLIAVENVGEALAAIGSATLWLSAWVDGTALDPPESAAVSQPLIAALLSVSNKQAPSEADLFVKQMQRIGAVIPVPAEPPRVAGAAVVVARKLLLPFQSLLLMWLKGQDAARVLAKLHKVAEQIAINAAESSTYTLWVAAAAAIDSMLLAGAGETPELKRCLGRLGQHLRALAEQGESAADNGDTALRLMVHSAPLGTPGSYWQALFARLPLASTLPLPATLKAQRQRLQGPDSALLEQAGLESRRELTRVKDGIDLAVRAGALEGSVLASVRENLARLASTLQMLRFGHEADDLRRLAGSEFLSHDELTAAHPELLPMAVTLLRVEHSLLATAGRALGPSEDGCGPHPRELYKARVTLVRELRVNLARLKGLLDAACKGGGPDSDAEPVALLTQSAAAIRLCGAIGAANHVVSLADYLSANTTRFLVRDRSQSGLYAEAITLLELVLDDLPTGINERWLDALGLRIGKLNFEPPLTLTLTPVVAEAEPLSRVLAATDDTGSAAAAENGETLQEPDQGLKGRQSPAAGDDPEIRAIFIEEAREVCTTIERALPKLRREANEQESMALIRRSFHTLKGSGRMVGATSLGDAAWSLEHLLNRCLDGALPLNEAVHALLAQAMVLLPALLARYQDGHGDELSADGQELIAKAHYLASGNAPEMIEADVLAIFREDALERLTAVQDWLKAGTPRASGAEALRALHTIKGSASAVNAGALSQLAGALESLLDAVRDSGAAVPETVVALLGDAMPTMRIWVRNAGAATTLSTADWLARIEPLTASLRAGAGEGLQARRESFSVEAFEGLQEIEAQVVAWSAAGTSAESAAKVIAKASELAARAKDCHGAGLAKSLEELSQLAVAAAGEAKLEGTRPKNLFQVLVAHVERLYQLLDEYRIGISGEEPITPVKLQLDVALQEGGQHAPDSNEGLAEPSGISGPAHFNLDPISAAPAAPDLAPEPEAAHAPAAVDTELHAIFAAETRDHVTALQRCLTALGDGDLAAAQNTQQILHTLVGSAHMAGKGELAARFSAIWQLQQADGDPGDIAVQLQAAIASLPAEYLPAGQIEPAAQLEVNRAEVAGELPPTVTPKAESAPSSAPESPTIHEQVPDVLEATIDLPPARAIQEPQAAALALPSPGVVSGDEGIDPELADIFAAETAETLENMSAALGNWRNGMESEESARILQRNLHTLKGGARILGFMHLGNLAHEMETHVDALVSDHRPPSAGDFERLQNEIDELERQHDGLMRGHYSSLLKASESAAVSKAEEPIPATLAETLDGTPAEHVLAATIAPEPAPAPPPAVKPPTPVGWRPELFAAEQEEVAAAAPRELARVGVDVLDSLLKQAGEVSIVRARVEQQNNALTTQLAEVSRTVLRLRDQLRQMEQETEAQIVARGYTGPGTEAGTGDFDPLEMDRYTRMQEISRALSETVTDMAALHGTLDEIADESGALLRQQGRINSIVQQRLMESLMVPFSRQVPRLERLIRQTAEQEGRLVAAKFSGVDAELDRNVLERITPALEHLLRNAIVHGIEAPAARAKSGKAGQGTLSIAVRREGSQLLLEVNDDGNGLDYAAIRATAISRGLLHPGIVLPEDELARLIFQHGFSTAAKLTQNAGRGVGLDVVAAEIKQLGGALELRSKAGAGTRFAIRLPLSLAVSQALMVQVGGETFALPLTAIEGIARLPQSYSETTAGSEAPAFAYADRNYSVRFLADLVQHPRASRAGRSLPAVLLRLGETVDGQERRAALVVEHLLGNQEIVTRPVGPLVAGIRGVAGATILPSGDVVLILDATTLLEQRTEIAPMEAAEHAATVAVAELAALESDAKCILVVDDSVTIRRVAERLLTRQGYTVITAKDGVDAMMTLQTEAPHAILLDIEMPRADGFEVASFVRNNPRIAHTPIIMITSRSGDKHRTRAQQLGVNRYLIKPWHEDILLAELRSLLAAPELATS